MTSPPPRTEGLLFYSGVSGRAYHPDRLLAAEAITAQATRPIDFPAVIEQAYADGFRIFLEMGPGGSCTRLIGRILADRPHLAHSVCLPVRDPLGTVLEALAKLIAYRIPVDLEPLYGRKTLAVGLRPDDHDRPAESDRLITIDLVRSPPGPTASTNPAARRPGHESQKRNRQAGARACAGARARHVPIDRSTGGNRGRHGQPHEAFLRVSHRYGALIGKNLEYQLGLIEALSNGVPADSAASLSPRHAQVALDRAPVPGVCHRLDCRGAGT